MEKQKISNSDRVKSSGAYIPLVGFFLHFTEKNQSDFLKKHIKYGNTLFLGFIVIRFLLWSVFQFFILSSLFSLIYIVTIGVLAYKIYNGEDINIDSVDKFENKIKNEMNDEEKSKNDTKKEEFNEETVDEQDIKTNSKVVDGIAGGLTNIIKKAKEDEPEEESEFEKAEKRINESIPTKKEKNEDILDF